MDKYFVLMRLTDKGSNRLDDVAELLEGVRTKMQQDGFIAPDSAIHVLFGGSFDFIAECEASTFDDAAYFAIELAKTGVVLTATQRAYSVGDLETMVRHKMAP